MQHDSSDDVPTIIAIAVIAYAIANVVHEGLGHGVACVACGGQPRVLSTVHFDCSFDNRFILAAGTLANLIAGALCFALLRLVRRASPHLQYFLWLSMTVNLLIGGGYFLFSGVANFGDWAEFIAGFQPSWAWRVGLILLGAVTYLLFVWLAVREMRAFVANAAPDPVKRAARLALVPYFTGGILATIAGLLNPVGMFLVAASAAASTFGGTSGLAWMWQMLKGAAQDGPPPPPLSRRWIWIGTAAVVAALFIFLLGPGFRFAAKLPSAA